MRTSGNRIALAGAMMLSGCAGIADWGSFDQGGGNVPVLTGASVTENRTPVDDALLCYGAALGSGGARRSPIGIGVGEVRDFTGRVTEGEGAPITQGAGLRGQSEMS